MERPTDNSVLERAFESAKAISRDEYKSMAGQDIPDGFDIKMDQGNWYFKHDQCHNIIRTFADNVPSIIDRMLRKHAEQCKASE